MREPLVTKKESVFMSTDFRCWFCGCIIFPSINASIDHNVPLSRGGSSNLYNLLPCCVKCNSRKRDFTLEEYRERCGGGPFWGELQGPEIASLGYSEDAEFALPRTYYPIEGEPYADADND